MSATEFTRTAIPRTPEDTTAAAELLADGLEAVAARPRSIFRPLQYQTPVGAPVIDAAPFPLVVRGLPRAGPCRAVYVASVEQPVGALSPVTLYWRPGPEGDVEVRCVTGLQGGGVARLVLELRYG